MGPWSRVQRYASEELKSWFAQHGRLTVDEFETQWWNGCANTAEIHALAALADIA